MEKRVPKSEKYAHVQGRLDTGLTVEKVKYVTAREYSKRREEIFFRINCGQLNDLFSEYEHDEYESLTDSFRGGDDTLKIVTHSADTAEAVYNKPYLILDVREAELYNECHIVHGRSFPFALLRRDQLHPDVYRFRNKPETLIILYCNDEKTSCEAAKIMVDRGIDNIYVLNGGLYEFAEEFASYIEGAPPMGPSSRSKKASSASSSSRATTSTRKSSPFEAANDHAVNTCKLYYVKKVPFAYLYMYEPFQNKVFLFHPCLHRLVPQDWVKSLKTPATCRPSRVAETCS